MAMNATGVELSRSPLRNIAVVIPAWRPDERLVQLAKSLSAHLFAAVVVVDDGSGEEFKRIFDLAGAIPSVVVLRHEQNRGQGRAVKTALRFVLDNVSDLTGAVTADADGQHAVDDIVRVAQRLAQGGDRVVLGSRAFGAGVPLRSQFGNTLTQYVFAALSGYRVADTQSGLRGIPKEAIQEVLKIRGERYEFATSLLAHFCNRGRPPAEMPIATIYMDGNRSSHFHPVRDSIRIYLTLVRCYSSLLVPVFIDLTGFVVAYAIGGGIAWAVAAGRLGAIAALLLQRIFGYSPQGPAVGHRIAMLALSGIGAFAGIWFLIQLVHWNFIAAKIVVELVFWLVLIPMKAMSRWYARSESV